MGIALSSIGGLIDIAGVFALYGTVWGWWSLGLVVAPFLFATGTTLLVGSFYRNPWFLLVLFGGLSIFLELVFRLGLFGFP